MSGHTPGIILQPLVPHGWRFLDADGVALAEVYNVELAYLLAAAPDLLDACQKYLAAEQQLVPGGGIPYTALAQASQAMKAAVAKAMGEVES